MPLFGRKPTGNDIEELHLVAAILATCGDDPRSKSLFEQYALAKMRNRRQTPDGFTVEPGGKLDKDLVVDLGQDVASEWVAVHDTATKTALEFRIVLHQGGRFGALEGRAPGGSWPESWRLDAVELAQSARGCLELPPAPG